jgi:hypothetical protein
MTTNLVVTTLYVPQKEPRIVKPLVINQYISKRSAYYYYYYYYDHSN